MDPLTNFAQYCAANGLRGFEFGEYAAKIEDGYV